MVTTQIDNPVSGASGIFNTNKPSAGTIPVVQNAGVSGGGLASTSLPLNAGQATLTSQGAQANVTPATVNGSPVGNGGGQQNGGGDPNNGSWFPGKSTTALIAPNAAAYTPQNAQQLLNTAQGLTTLGEVPGAGQVSNVNLGQATQYGAAQGQASTYGPSSYTAGNMNASTFGPSTFNAAGISPLMMLNGAQVATGTQNQNAAASQAAINNLNNIASGNGPNAATIAAQQTGQQQLAAQMAAIASAGGNPALAQRNAAQAAAQQAQQTQQAAVLGSAQEQLGAQGTLQSALNNITQTGQAIPLAQAQLAQQASLANQGVQAQGATTQAQMAQASAAANAAATQGAAGSNAAAQQAAAAANQQAYNAALSQGASQAQAAAAGNAAANNAMTLANQAAVNTAAATNAGALNAQNLQQGTMNQQTNLANQQALLSSVALNANQQNAALGAQMQQSSYDTSQAEAYQQEYQQAQENLAALASGQGIASMQNTAQLTGAGIGAGAAALSALSALSDKTAKTNIASGKRDIYSFLASINVPIPNRFTFMGVR